MLSHESNDKIPSPNASGDLSLPPGAASRPSSPLERNPLSPKGWKKRDSDGVGLSIVAKLDNAAFFLGDGIQRSKFLVRTAETGCSGKLLEADGGEFPVADFLRRCFLCRNKLHGKDIYMYRGETAFCSDECRKQQIASDEYMEKWGTEVLRRAEVSSTPCSGEGTGDKVGRLFFDGIAAA